MKSQIKQQSIVFALLMVLFAFSIGSSAQTAGRGFSKIRTGRAAGWAAAGRKVAEELNPQPLPPCAKCGAVPVHRPGNDPLIKARIRPRTQAR